MKIDDGTEKWIRAGLVELSEGGIDRVRVEVIAKRLGVTKGAFYRRFKDRRALLDAMLEVWMQGRIATVDKQTTLAHGTPIARLSAVARLATTRLSKGGLAIELGVRQWAREDRPAAAAVARVDAHRIANVEVLYVEMGYPQPVAAGKALLMYSFLFGQNLVMLPGRQKQAILECALHELLSKESRPTGTLA